MRSVKPGRGPSAMGGIGAVAGVVFGIFWTIMAASMGAPVFFPIFGVLFVIIGIIQAVYHFKNAAGTNRFSEYDITEDGEEPDPLARRFESRQSGSSDAQETQCRYCPYCGARLGDGFAFCGRCGRQLPDIQ